MLEISFRPWGGKQEQILKIPKEKLRHGEGFLSVLDKFLKKSKMKSIEFERLEILRGEEELGFTSRQMIQTAIKVFNIAVSEKRRLKSEKPR